MLGLQKGLNKDYLYGCGAPDYDDDFEETDEQGCDEDERAYYEWLLSEKYESESKEQLIERYFEHQREEGKIK